MKTVHNSILPFKGFKAVNILGVLFVREGTEDGAEGNYIAVINRYKRQSLWWLSLQR